MQLLTNEEALRRAIEPEADLDEKLEWLAFRSARRESFWREITLDLKAVEGGALHTSTLVPDAWLIERALFKLFPTLSIWMRPNCKKLDFCPLE